MLLIPCPNCGLRAEREFRYGGEAHIVRPKEPDKLSDEAWAEYVFMRTNPKGVHFERWYHAHGCRRWFNAARHSLSDEFLAVYGITEPPPELEEPQAP